VCIFVFFGQNPKLFGFPLMVLSSGSVYVINMGSVHGTFVSDECLSKENPVELEVGQSLCFAASTRSHVLQKNMCVPSAASSQPPTNFVYPPSADPADE
jgi:nuclear inhibitor of protein phosphatase 1